MTIQQVIEQFLNDSYNPSSVDAYTRARRIQTNFAIILRKVGDLQEQIDTLPTGGGSGGSFYIHNQASPLSSWSITHNLGYYPNVTVVDSSNRAVLGEVVYTDPNTLSVQFSAAFGGKAYLS